MQDLIIIGAGTAGMACAITAAQQGARVTVIEKSDHIGGALHWSGGHMSAGGTRRQKAKGIEDSPEAHLADIMRINGGSGDPALIRMAVMEAPHTIDWLEDIGFEFAPECPRIIYGHVPYDRERTHYGVDKAMSIYKVMKPLWDEQLASGNISLFLQHEVTGLEQETGRFNTVIASSDQGEQRFKGKHIVLTTGGYGSAPDYFKEKHPGVPLVSSTYPTATGDGHRLAERFGAEFRMASHHLPSLGGLEMVRGSGRCDFNKAWAMVLTSIYRQPREIYVNQKGQRFMREDEENADTRERIAIQQPGWKFWLIFDESALLERMENGAENPIIIGWDTKRIKAAAKLEGPIYQADSIAELAQQCKLPATALQASIDEINEAVANGKDPRFGRSYLRNTISQAPYYAIEVHASVLVTFGGIRVNEQLQLCDHQGQVLQGLYAAGEILGLGATSGSAFCSGMAITPALSFGRILGRKLGSEGGI